MKAILGFLLIGAFGLGSLAQKDGGQLLGSWSDALKSKQEISAKIRVQTVGGTTEEYSVDLKKPDQARIETADEITIADGKEVTVYDKKLKIFYKRPQVAGELPGLLGRDEFALVAPFFGKPATAPSKVKELAPKTVAGEQVRVLEALFGSKGKKRMVLYVPKDLVAKKAELQITKDDGNSNAIISAQLQAKVGQDLFAFKAPEDANEVKYEDLIASKWFDELEQAQRVAEKTNKLIFVDFMATWCGPCKKMAKEVFETEEFKALGKKVVFCKIDIDLNPLLADKYKVDAIPHVFILRPDGTVVGDVLGYGDKDTLMKELEDILAKEKK